MGSFTVLYWDWKSPAPIDEIADAQTEVFDEAAPRVPSLTQVEDGSDNFVLVVATHELTQEQADVAVVIWGEQEELPVEEQVFDGLTLPTSLIEARISA